MPRPSDRIETVASRAWGDARRTVAGRRLDSPAVPAVIAALGGATFVLLRLAVVAKGDVTRFVMAGSDFVDRARAPAGLHAFVGTGYDGQFYYRLALDPADLSRTAFGITMDSFFRLQRIGYPLLSWLAAAGQHPLVPDAEIAINAMASAGLAWLGAEIARDAGLHSGPSTPTAPRSARASSSCSTANSARRDRSRSSHPRGRACRSTLTRPIGRRRSW